MSAPRGSLHARLRAATGPAHAALERELDWQTCVATLPGYGGLLVRLHGFHAAWEPGIGAALADPAFFDPRRRLALLTRDLADLGLSPAVERVPPSPVEMVDAASALGALYVLEGSTLGGRIIARHIARVHGEGTPCAYYRAHGTRCGAMWTAFKARLDAVPEPDAPVVTAAAVETFSALRGWLGAADSAAGRSRRPQDGVEAGSWGSGRFAPIRHRIPDRRSADVEAAERACPFSIGGLRLG